MTVTEYSKILDQSSLDFNGNNISKQCKNFLQGILEKNVKYRFTFDQAANHPWIMIIKDKVEEIYSKYQSDPDKMISMMNLSTLGDSFFENKAHLDLNVFEEETQGNLLLMNKKRKRAKKA